MAINCSISGGAPLFLVLQLIVHPFADARCLCGQRCCAARIAHDRVQYIKSTPTDGNDTQQQIYNVLGTHRLRLHAKFDEQSPHTDHTNNTAVCS